MEASLLRVICKYYKMEVFGNMVRYSKKTYFLVRKQQPQIHHYMQYQKDISETDSQNLNRSEVILSFSIYMNFIIQKTIGYADVILYNVTFWQIL